MTEDQPAPAAQTPPTPSEDFIIEPDTVTRQLDLGSIFPSPQPLAVDLGCGKGRFLVARASGCSDFNFLGIDRQLKRLRKVNKKIHRAGVGNVRLLRLEASYAVTYLLPPGSVSIYYVFFPDPWPKKRHHRRRLFASDDFMEALVKTLAPNGQVHVATDHLGYFAEIEEIFAAHPDFAPAPIFEPTEDERTDFELIFLNQSAPIGRGSFLLKP